MSPQAIKSGIISYHSSKNFTQFRTGGVYFQTCIENLGYYCGFLSGFSHQDFTDNMCCIWGQCNR